MDKQSEKLSHSILNILLIFAVIIAVLGFIVDVNNTIQYGGVDLRNRVVAARLLIEGVDPYYFKWLPGMSDLFLDPIADPSWPVSRATIPPTVLMLHAVIANLPYFHQKIIWLFLQWGLFLSSLVILNKLTDSKIESKLLWIVGLLFFSGSNFWRLHVERGQIYVLYMFLLSFAYYLVHKSFKYNYFFSGFLIGLTASLRFPVILICIPMLIFKQFQLLIGALLGLVISILFSFSFANISIWQSYFSAMKIYEGVHSGVLKFNSNDNSFNVNTTRYQQVEGMHTLSKVPGLPSTDTSFQSIFQHLGINLSSGLFVFLFSVILLIICFLIYKKSSRKSDKNLLFLSGIWMILASEYFMPVTRSSYNDVQWFLPVSIIIIAFNNSKLLTNKLNIILLFGLFLSFGFNWLPESLRISSMMLLIYTFLRAYL